jgi:hypothetical protein
LATLDEPTDGIREANQIEIQRFLIMELGPSVL